MNDYLVSLGNNIKIFRKAKKLSQVELAKLIHVSDVAISTWEKGKVDPTSSNIVALAKIFDTSTDDLLNFKHNNNSMFLEKHFSNTIYLEDNNKIIITLKK